MAASDINLTYEISVTLNEALLDAIEHLEDARQSSEAIKLEFHLKMASRALRCALEIYRDWLAEEVRKEGDNEHV